MATEFKCGVVIPALENRLDNLERVLQALQNQTVKPKQIVVVCDGWGPGRFESGMTDHNEITWVHMQKYEPSSNMIQPRNLGANELWGCNYVWFLDSDVLPLPTTLEAYQGAWSHHKDIDRVLIGPYEWMEQGIYEPILSLENDPRWQMFKDNDPDVVKTNDLGYALGCFSGNLVWPLEQFKQIGGFWNELHMGRCEDGELGLRAASLGVPMSVVRGARGFHMGHEVNVQQVYEKNSRDVPLIHSRHGEVEKTGLKIVNEDGKRLNYICPDCHEEFNTLLYWEHKCQNLS